MKKLVLIILLFSSLVAFSQPRGGGRGGSPSIKGKVTGTVIDVKTGDPMPYVTVVVRSEMVNKNINGTVTSDNGEFKISNIPMGEYVLQVSFVGYETLSQNFKLTLKNPDMKFKGLKLGESATQLNEVVIEGERELIESKIDKIVYNAERDAANSGGDATDVLRRAPLLSVDLEGNVSLRGSSNVQILVNGKPSSLLASNPGDVLSVLPADQIKSVEVITTPSAKFDGEGSAGIVNIITKKKNIEGFAGNVNASVGNRQNNGVLGIQVGKGRFGFNANASTFFRWPQDGSSEFFREDFVSGGSRTLEENGVNESGRIGYFGSGGLFYDFNAYNSVTSSFRVRGFGRNADSRFMTTFADPVNSINQQYSRQSDTESSAIGYEWSLDYLMKFPGQKDRELSFAYKIDGNTRNQDFVITQEDMLGNDPLLFRDERNNNDGDNTETTIQVDYVHPIGKKLKVETGAKTVLRDVISDYVYENFDSGLNQYVIDQTRTDIFNYDQDVFAGYISGTFQFNKKTGLIMGARYEHTDIQGSLQEGQSAFDQDYDNWLPSITFSRKIGRTNTVKVGFNRRIQRPSLRFINPYEQVDNNRNVSTGNPELRPELTDQVEISYNAFIKKVLFNASVFYRRTTDIIESFLEVDNQGVSVTNFRNVGEANSVGINMFTSAKLLKIWTLRGGINLFTYDASGNVNGQSLSNQAILWNGNISSNVDLGNSWTLDLFGFYRAPRQTLQGINPSFSIMVMGVKKTIWEKRGTIGIRIVEPFFENKAFGSELEGPTFVQTSEFVIPFRSFGVNFGYKFGKLDFRQRQRRSKIRNDDLKQGGDGQEGGGVGNRR